MKIQNLFFVAFIAISTSFALGNSSTTFTITLEGGGRYDGRYPVATPNHKVDLKPADSTGGYNRSPDGTYYSKCGAEPYGCNFLSKGGADLIINEGKADGLNKLDRLDATHKSELDKLQLDWEAVINSQPPVQGGAAAFVADLEKKKKQATEDLRATSAKLAQVKTQSTAAAVAKVQHATGKKISTHPEFNYTKASYQPLQNYTKTANAEGVFTGTSGPESNRYAAEMLIKQAEGAFKAGFPVAAIRLYEHSRILNSYQQGRAEADGYTDIVLSPEAAERYGFSNNEIIADTYYGYGIISASNELTKLTDISKMPQAHLLAFLHLQNANLARLSDNLPAFNHALESAWAVADYLKGFGSGIVESIYDSVTGTWQMITHPISTLENLTNAIINHEKTIEIISEQLTGVIDNYDNLSVEEKARLHGKIATEIGSMFLGIGALKKTSDVAKVSSWLNKSSVNIANTAKVFGIQTAEGIKVLGKIDGAMGTLPGILKVQRIFEGNSVSKVAIIGRSMAGCADDTAQHFLTKNVKTETFVPSREARENWTDTVKKYRKSVSNPNARLPFDEVKKTTSYAENKAWAEKLVGEKYTILDMGDPLGRNATDGFSAFYEIEKKIIFGEIQ